MKDYWDLKANLLGTFFSAALAEHFLLSIMNTRIFFYKYTINSAVENFNCTITSTIYWNFFCAVTFKGFSKI